MTQLGPTNGAGAEEVPGQPLLPPWASVGVGHVDNPEAPGVHIAVALLVGTANGQLAGALMPDFAKQLGEQLLEHAASCSSLTVAGELPPELRGL